VGERGRELDRENKRDGTKEEKKEGDISEQSPIVKGSIECK
jgi:hypothetical protein